MYYQNRHVLIITKPQFRSLDLLSPTSEIPYHTNDEDHEHMIDNYLGPLNRLFGYKKNIIGFVT